MIVLTFHKTGTTWCQQIAHQLRTGGHTDFAEITEVMPWIDFGWEVNQDLNQDQVAEPRLFKSHARLSAVQEGCKYLCTIRDPVKTLVSLFNFFCGKFLPKPPFPASWLANVDNFAKCPLWAIDSIWGGNYWEYMTEFFLARKVGNVKVLCFEEMLKDTKGYAIPQIADFMGLEAKSVNEELVEKVAALSSKEWMAEHDAMFSEGWFYDEQLKHKRYDLPPLPPVAKVTSSSAAASAQPTDETKAWMDSQWAKLVSPRTGCKNYDEMRLILVSEMA
mmetsp:Transcript_71845/g.123449  ORF Transcript_71845/g.123449 Transcript_71845/m.123449 type:complete len:276 (-) Transcript_71845:515-1342(-)